MAKKYSFKDKIKYYQARVKDKTLTRGQRDYAQNFLNGAGINDPNADSYSAEEIKSKIVAIRQDYQELVANTLDKPDLLSVFLGKHAGEIAYWESKLK